MTDLSVPHIYKKGKILRIKTASPTDGKTYLFRIGTGSILRNANSLNNLNEVLDRVYMTVYKIASSFGISKDPTEKVSKETSTWMKTLKLLTGGRGLIPRGVQRKKFLENLLLANHQTVD